MSYAYYKDETGESIFDSRGKPYHTEAAAARALDRYLRCKYGWTHHKETEKLAEALGAFREEWTLAEIVMIDRAKLAVLEEKAAKYDGLNK